jgi:hypothetical protein
MIPPMVPVPPRGAISDGIDQPTGDAAASPLSATEIQMIAQTGLVVSVAPNTARPSRYEHGLAHRRLVVAARDQVIDLASGLRGSGSPMPGRRPASAQSAPVRFARLGTAR